MERLTGFKDKNGNEISDGDLLAFVDFDLEVFWDDTCGWLVCGGFLSGDGLEYYADRTIIKQHRGD